MSSRKRPFAELQNSQTPSRYAPSTPHAIRALQQRSGAKTRSVRSRRAFSDTVRPDSARGILRQLAKLTAPATKRIVPTPGTVKGKENHAPDDGNTQRIGKRPQLTLDFDDSFESIEAPEIAEDEEEDSDLPIAPTPSVLPDDDDDDDDNPALDKDNPTFTLKSIDYARAAQSPEFTRQSLGRSFPASDPAPYHDVDEESTFLSERGRRAPTVEPTENLSRYDLGDIDVNDPDHLSYVKSPDKTQAELAEIDASFPPFEEGAGETEALQHLEDLQRSPSLAPPDESHADIPTFDDSNFQLPEPETEFEAVSNQVRASPQPKLADASILDHSVERSDNNGESDLEVQKEDQQQQVEESEIEELAESHPLILESSKPSSQSRRKKMKLTRHGEMVPALPSSLIKRVAIETQARLGNRRPKLGKDHMKALEQATEWFFEQVGEDLEAYSSHGRRKRRIDQSDVLLLMRRQRVLQGDGELLKAARELLPKEVVADMNLDELSEA